MANQSRTFNFSDDEYDDAYDDDDSTIIVTDEDKDYIDVLYADTIAEYGHCYGESITLSTYDAYMDSDGDVWVEGNVVYSAGTR